MRKTLMTAAMVLMGCGQTGELSGHEEAVGMEPEAAFSQDIVDILHTSFKRQSIGNCWVYATASWSESLIKAAGNGDLNLSESYWTYFHWYEQITQWQPDSISTGGNFRTIARIIARYGAMEEGTFIPAEAEVEMSARQARAQRMMDASLASGALSTPEARRDRALVRQEMDKAWELSPEVIAQLDTAFGPSMTKNFRNGATNLDTSIKRDTEIKVQYAVRGQQVQKTLAQAFGDWTESYYPSYPASQRAFQQKMQRALHDGVPVILTWFVDFNALGGEGKFEGIPAQPGNQGYHMTLAEDYEVDNVPGFGLLKAGELETRPEALAAALAPEATLVKIRTKNSWGGARFDRQFVPGFPGYHDLYMSYLNGPIKECNEVGGHTDPTDCPSSIVPLQSIIVPRSYLY
jgi:hypothetical protein